ncbi:MAG: GntR family transcriptional regulator [Gemmataceae bacterium]|nr:GntR family transcriptional regulator [Gemmataceae bacterium]
METTLPRAPRIVQLADRIAADIRRRRLKPGDSYLTTAETARLLGISTTAANRAMQLLVQRQVLERRQRKGTTVAPVFTPATAAPLRRVHLLVHKRYLETEGLLADGRVIGIQSQLPGADIQFSFWPEGDETAFVRRLLDEALAARLPEGFVASRASLAAQRALAESGLPVVLTGTAYPAVRGLPWIDRDHRQIGRLLAEHLLERGARWIALFMRERMLQGDHLVFDAVRDTLAAAGLPADALGLRCLPNDAGAIAAEVQVLLEGQREKGAILCRGTPLADAVTAAIDAQGIAPKAAPALAVCDVFMPADAPCAYPYARPVFGPEPWGARIGRMLACQARREPLTPQTEVVPVELVLPASFARRKGTN